MIDGPALDWLARQPEPRFWLSDGQVTGIICHGPEELPAAIGRAERVSPAACRTHAARRFDLAQMAEAYEAVYPGSRSRAISDDGCASGGQRPLMVGFVLETRA